MRRFVWLGLALAACTSNASIDASVDAPSSDARDIDAPGIDAFVAAPDAFVPDAASDDAGTEAWLSGLAYPTAVALDSTHVYFAAGDATDRVFRASRSAPVPEPIFGPVASVYDLAASGSFVYVAACADTMTGTIERIDTASLASSSIATCCAYDVHWEGGYVYWPCSDGIYRAAD